MYRCQTKKGTRGIIDFVLCCVLYDFVSSVVRDSLLEEKGESITNFDACFH